MGMLRATTRRPCSLSRPYNCRRLAIQRGDRREVDSCPVRGRSSRTGGVGRGCTPVAKEVQAGAVMGGVVLRQRAIRAFFHDPAQHRQDTLRRPGLDQIKCSAVQADDDDFARFWFVHSYNFAGDPVLHAAQFWRVAKALRLSIRFPRGRFLQLLQPVFQQRHLLRQVAVLVSLPGQGHALRQQNRQSKQQARHEGRVGE